MSHEALQDEKSNSTPEDYAVQSISMIEIENPDHTYNPMAAFRRTGLYALQATINRVEAGEPLTNEQIQATLDNDKNPPSTS